METSTVTAAVVAAPPSSSGPESGDVDTGILVTCRMPGCGAQHHSLAPHLKTVHNMDIAAYRTRFPGAEYLSPKAKANLAKAQQTVKGAPRPVSPPKPVEGVVSSKDATTGAPAPKEDKVLHFGVATLTLRDDLTPAEERYVPPHDEDYQLDDQKLELLSLGLQQGENIMLVGPTGCGKTTLVYELGAIIHQPVRRINLHGDVRAADFLGEKVIEVDPATQQAIVVWRNGILPDAMEKGHWLLLDEMDAAPAAILFVLQSILEGGDLVLAGDSGRVVTRHPNFRVIATANTLGKGDETGLYTGTNVMNEAFLDRFGTVLLFDYANERDEVKILTDKAKIDEPTAKKMREVAALIRSGLEKEECYCTFSTRRLLAWARKTVALRGKRTTGGHWRAAEITIFNKLTKDDRKYVEGVVQRVLTKA